MYYLYNSNLGRYSVRVVWFFLLRLYFLVVRARFLNCDLDFCCANLVSSSTSLFFNVRVLWCGFFSTRCCLPYIHSSLSN